MRLNITIMNAGTIDELRFDRHHGTAPMLRPYQSDAIHRLDECIGAGQRFILLVAPTGSGKTVIAGALIQREASAGKQILFLAPRRELIEQASRKLADVGVHHGIILAGDRRSNLNARVQVASIDTLRARPGRTNMLNPDLVIVDEAHLYITEIRRRLLDQWPEAIRVGLTATPCRKDGRGLALMFDDLIEVSSTGELTRLGFLVPARYYSVSEPDLSRVHSLGGDYKVNELAQAMAPLVADIPATWLERAGNRRTAVFAVNVAHSVALAAAFRAQCVRAEHVDGGTPLPERASILARFVSGETQVLVNVLVASIGFDLPALECIQLARPTKSLALYLQMIGRGLRPAPGKTDCLVLDHSGAVHRFGFAHDERFWTLDGHADLSVAKAERERSEGKPIDCPQCAFVFVGSRVCPSCGHYIAPKGTIIRTLDGDLVEVGEHLAADGQTRLAFFLELRGYAQERQFKPGFAAHKFRAKYGTFPPWNWNDAPAAIPTPATRNWIRSRNIAAAKMREREPA